jgi:hypothetical protein
MSDNRIAELQGSVFAMIGLQFWQILNGIKWENVATGVITSVISAVAGYYIIKLVKWIERRMSNGTR